MSRIRRVLLAAGLVCLVFTFVWTGFHPTPDAPNIAGILLAFAFLRASAFEWGPPNRRRDTS
jgi:hypothetical protein